MMLASLSDAVCIASRLAPALRTQFLVTHQSSPLSNGPCSHLPHGFPERKLHSHSPSTFTKPLCRFSVKNSTISVTVERFRIDCSSNETDRSIKDAAVSEVGRIGCDNQSETPAAKRSSSTANRAVSSSSCFSASASSRSRSVSSASSFRFRP